MTTYTPPPSEPVTPASAQASWLAALLRDIAIVLAVVVYVIDTL